MSETERAGRMELLGILSGWLSDNDLHVGMDAGNRLLDALDAARAAEVTQPSDALQGHFIKRDGTTSTTYGQRRRERARGENADSLNVRRHRYERSRFSGAGNCHCGRGRESRLHPHAFKAWWKDERRCVCGMRRWALIHLRRPR